jgi:(R,R)-butanediol dehydrogenase/meso-butanediol dehydrogenase/diacetyl reductase
MKTMLAARYLGPNRLEPKEVPLPTISDEEALVQVDACGFCGSDISIVAGTHPRATAPLTLGHELSGRIVQMKSSSGDFRVGHRVTSFPLISCGECHACKNNNSHVCRKLRLFGFDVDGGMAEFVKLPIFALMRLPEEMPGNIGALVEPLAVAVHGVGRANLKGVRTAVVLGGGPIGLLTALVVKQCGVPAVIVSDILTSRLELAANLGLQTVLAGESLKKLVMQLSDRNGADVVFECAGAPSSAGEMTSLVCSRGVIVNLGVFKKPVQVDMQAINFKEVTLVGSRVYERKDFQVAIDLAMRLPLAPIVTHAFPLREVATAFQQFQLGQICKALILPMGHLA